MPHISVVGNYFLLRPKEDDASLHFQTLCTTLSQLMALESCTDVIIHCKNQTRIRANKVILAYSSGLLRHILSSNCDCAGSFIPITYNILLPDFNPEPVQKILDLIYYGFTSISKDNDMLINEMDSICKTLDITSLPSFKNVISESSLTNYNQLPVPVHSEKIPTANRDLSRLSTHTNISMSSSSTPSDKFSLKPEPMLWQEELVQEMTPIPKDGGGIVFPFVCQKCDKGFSVLEALEKHVKRHNKQALNSSIGSKSIYTCLICNQAFSGMGALEKHVEIHTSGEEELMNNSNEPTPVKFRAENEPKPEASSNDKAITESIHKCDTCSNQFDNLADFVNHLGSCNVDNDSKKETCSKSIVSKKRKISGDIHKEGSNSKQTHLVTDEQKEVKSSHKEQVTTPSSKAGYKCHLCSTKKTVFNDLMCHIAAEHFRADMLKLTNADATQCNLCSKQLKSELDIMNHFASFHKVLAGLVPSKDKLTVKQESKSVAEKNKQKLITRNKVAGSLPSFKCNMCDYKNNTKGNVKTHLGIKHFKTQVFKMNGPNLNECVFCKKETPKVYSLISHLVNKHSALDKIQDNKNSENEELKFPQNFEALTYKCLSCEVKSESYSNLMIHMAFQHKEDIYKMFGANEWVCFPCGKKEMSQVKHLMYHLVCKHSVIAKFPEKLSFMVVSGEDSDLVDLEDTAIKDQANALLAFEKRKLICDVCNESQTDYKVFLKHVETMHSDYTKSLTLPKSTAEDKQNNDRPIPHKKNNSVIICKICNEKYPNEQACKDHIQLKHKSLDISKLSDQPANKEFSITKVGVWNCITCNENHSSATALLEHMRSVHQSFDKTILEPMRIPIKPAEPQLQQKTSKNVEREPAENKKNKSRISNTSIYKCPQCHEMNSSYAFLLTHIALSHYKDKMLGYLSENEKKCSVCKQIFDTKLDLIYHLTNDHNVLEKYLPPKASMATAIQIKESTEPEISDVVTKYRCHVCPSDFVSYDTLLNHHATSHFKKKLVENYGNDFNQCFHCSKNYTTQTQLLLHLVSSHEVLTSYLPDKKSLEIQECTKVKTEAKVRTETKVHPNDRKTLKCKFCLKMYSHKGPFKMHTVSCSKKKAESERKKEHAEIAIEKEKENVESSIAQKSK